MISITFVVLSVFFVSTSQKECPPQWKSFDSSCYLVRPDPNSFNAIDCPKHSHILQTETTDEENFIIELLRDQPEDQRTMNAWVGAVRHDNSWSWIAGDNTLLNLGDRWHKLCQKFNCCLTIDGNTEDKYNFDNCATLKTTICELPLTKADQYTELCPEEAQEIIKNISETRKLAELDERRFRESVLLLKRIYTQHQLNHSHGSLHSFIGLLLLWNALVTAYLVYRCNHRRHKRASFTSPSCDDATYESKNRRSTPTPFRI